MINLNHNFHPISLFSRWIWVHFCNHTLLIINEIIQIETIGNFRVIPHPIPTHHHYHHHHHQVSFQIPATFYGWVTNMLPWLYGMISRYGFIWCYRKSHVLPYIAWYGNKHHRDMCNNNYIEIHWMLSNLAITNNHISVYASGSYLLPIYNVESIHKIHKIQNKIMASTKRWIAWLGPLRSERDIGCISSGLDSICAKTVVLKNSIMCHHRMKVR